MKRKHTSYCFTPVFASEPINVKDYIKQKQYNLPTIFQLYLNPLNEDGLDENENPIQINGMYWFGFDQSP
ncbi:MAG: hypothetical protein KJ968_03110 [Nanoarchaeota archaeon]|nr:hypothetical protein [Nanoarchaeota archaeon]MBU4284069.1 hypothetical protein [Nanoarchaeota archaeon]